MRRRDGGATLDQVAQASPALTPLAPAVGAVVRRLRLERGWSRDELATRLGLPKWTRYQVLRLEHGEREGLSLVEALTLAGTLGVSVVDLLPAGDDLLVGTRTVKASTAHDLLTGGYAETRDEPHGGSREFEELTDAFLARSQVVVRAAKQLSVTPEQVVAASTALWGHGLLAERDLRLRDRLEPGAPLRQRQAVRGHVVRRLMRELSDHWADPPATDPGREGSTAH